MARLLDLTLVALTLVALTLVAVRCIGEVRAEELPSFMQTGDAFCSSEADFDDLVVHGKVRANSAIETCQLVMKPTRVAVLQGRGGVKTMVRVMNGPLAYSIGWTNGKLPLVR